MICADRVWNYLTGQNFSILHSNIFLGVALSLSAGTLLITALNALLPKSLAYIMAGIPDLELRGANALGVLMFMSGAVLCYIFNALVIRFTSDSVVSCPHDLEAGPPKNRAHSHSLACEHSLLLGSDVLAHVGPNHSATDQEPVSPTTPSPATASTMEDTYHSTDAEASRHRTHEPHRHELDTIGMLSIGLQTTVGIAVHRVPEGLLLFATSHTDKQLGLSLVLALSFHSYSEGFSIAAPLYKAIGSRSKVLVISLALGCGPQVLGAYIGSLIFNGSDELSDHSKLNFGLCIAATAGFMLVLSLQMTSVAFTYMSRKAAIRGIFAGCLISLLSRCV